MASKPKTLLMSEKMPRDFWNYDVNPITGYKTKRTKEMARSTN
jgi:hypothetical protein